jgi:hypothetical protein
MPPSAAVFAENSSAVTLAVTKAINVRCFIFVVPYEVCENPGRVAGFALAPTAGAILAISSGDVEL